MNFENIYFKENFSEIRAIPHHIKFSRILEYKY